MRIFTIIGIVALVVGGFFAYQAWFTPPSDDPFDVGKAAAPTIALTFLIIGGVFTTVGLLLTRMGNTRKQLLSEGIPGRAEIISVAETGMYVNEQPMVRMQLNVTVAGRPPYPVSHREVVPLLALGMITPGHVLPVAVDPTNANKLAIDWSGETQARSATLAAAGIGIGQGQMGWSAPGATPTVSTFPNTLSVTPAAPPSAMPQPNTLSSMNALGQSTPTGLEGGVGFAAPPSAASPVTFGGANAAGGATPADGMAAFLGYLKGSGIPGRALLRTVQDTGVAVRGDEVLMLQLEVMPNGGASYPVTTTAMLPQGTVGRAVPGASVAVYIDRSNPQAIAIDWDTP